jgi:uncharacterized membrane protein YeaQ/YmgE (transglycosylase-associated protein family)
MDAGSAAIGGLIGLLIFFAIAAAIGAAIGALARFLLPGPDNMSIGKTILYGIGGSFLGGIVGRMLGLQSWGLVLSVAMAMTLIWFFTRRNKTSG